jgi:hypothetical protein
MAFASPVAVDQSGMGAGNRVRFEARDIFFDEFWCIFFNQKIHLLLMPIESSDFPPYLTLRQAFFPANQSTWYAFCFIACTKACLSVINQSASECGANAAHYCKLPGRCIRDSSDGCTSLSGANPAGYTAVQMARIKVSHLRPLFFPSTPFGFSRQRRHDAS